MPVADDLLSKAFASVPEEVSGNATLMANTLAYVCRHTPMNWSLICGIERYHVAFNLDPKELSKSPEHDFFKTFYKNPQIGDLRYAAHSLARDGIWLTLFFSDRAQLVVSLVNDTNGQERIGIPHQNGGMAYADVIPLNASLGKLSIHPIDTASQGILRPRGH